MERYYQWLGGPGGYGVGYGAPAAVGAALANRAEGRFSVSIQSDGDLMYAPGVLWTAARHRIPLLSVMHNNRAYHQEVMHVQRMALRHNRDVTRAGIGTTLEDPNLDYAKIAQGMGIATVFQETLIVPEMTVRDNIYLGTDGLFRYGHRKGDEIAGARQALSDLGLDGLDLDRPMWTLSLA